MMWTVRGEKILVFDHNDARHNNRDICDGN